MLQESRQEDAVMKYEEPRMEIIILMDCDVVTASNELSTETIGGSGGGFWSEWN